MPNNFSTNFILKPTQDINHLDSHPEITTLHILSGDWWNSPLTGKELRSDNMKWATEHEKMVEGRDTYFINLLFLESIFAENKSKGIWANLIYNFQIGPSHYNKIRPRDSF